MSTHTREPTNEVATNYSKERSSTLSSQELQQLESQHPDMGHVLTVLQSSNEIRRKIESGEMDNLTAREAFETIWNIHSGNDNDLVKNLAFEESSVHRSSGFVSSETIDSVRLIPGQAPMLFSVPELSGKKANIVSAFFETVDELKQNPEATGNVWEIALKLQTWLDFLHIKDDGNGRASEDWMVWLQRVLLNGDQKQPKTQNLSTFSFSNSPVSRFSPKQRAWSQHGLRARSNLDHAQSVQASYAPKFLTEEAKELNAKHNLLIFERLLLMNTFRRDQYSQLASTLNYTGAPEDFHIFLTKNADSVVDHYLQQFKKNDFHIPGKLYSLLDDTGEYKYRFLQSTEIITSAPALPQKRS